MAALVRRGLRVQGFKVGPDFIDPGHHGAVTGRTSRNLDTWLLDPASLAATYGNAVQGADIAVVEGVMGLFDGRGGCDESGSTADLARLWKLPVVLVVDAQGLARSIAPLVLGYARFDSQVEVAAVIANNVGSRRHFDEYLAPALRAEAPVEAVGYLARDEAARFPSRHLGLYTADDLEHREEFFERLADLAEATLDLDRLLALARAPSLPALAQTPRKALTPRVQVAVARDTAFCFYYQDNLDLLRDAGAELTMFSPLRDVRLPEGVQLLYLGGGYPELHAEKLAANRSLRESIRRFHREGGAILAECGGMMACCQSLTDSGGRPWPMWDLIPANVVMHPRFSALGYVTVVVDRQSLFGPPGTALRGHVFHYSSLEPLEPLSYATSLHRTGRAPTPDGIAVGGLLAGYAHVHFGSNPEVVPRLLGSARAPGQRNRP
jgi:cobyrinic acid a,c-diamide synthase